MRLSFVVGFILALLSVSAHAQAPMVPDPAVTAAEKAYAAQEWTAAESQYAALVKQQPDNGRFWYRLGASARANKHYDVALEAMQKAKAVGNGKGFPASFADYEIATIYAGAGNSTQALEFLKSSADAGYMQPARLSGDTEWTGLRANEQFIALTKQVQHNASPCEDAEFRQLDFWIGDWDVVPAGGGIHQGTSHVSREMNGCVVWENWSSAGSPYFGKSYNTWNPNQKRWEQYWVDSAAGVMFFHGSLKDNVMDYWTDDVPQATGGTLLRHLQFFNLGPDKVRQFSRGSSDGGKTWHTEYDFIYTRVAKQD
jgi:tetratricopeptide (TPR) repeat protein